LPDTSPLNVAWSCSVKEYAADSDTIKKLLDPVVAITTKLADAVSFSEKLQTPPESEKLALSFQVKLAGARMSNVSPALPPVCAVMLTVLCRIE